MLQDFYSFIKIPMHSLNFKFNLLNIGELVFIAVVLLFTYKRFIKNTQAEKLVKGIFILLLTWAFSELLIKIDLQIIGVFLKTLVSIVIFSLVVVFQPELRKFLGFLGQTGFMGRSMFENNKQNVYGDTDVVKELIEAIKYFSKTKCGALIVLQRNSNELAYPEVGTKINADITTELIITIFHPNTPLHDGAMVIQGNKILSAGVLLPLTEDPKLSWRYGTRHRAAIGMSEVSDSACLVVSEETGDVSIAMDGILKKYEDISDLRVDLESILGLVSQSADDEKKILFNLIKIKSKNRKDNV